MKETKEMRALLNSAQDVTLPSGQAIKVFAVPWKYAPVFTRAAEPLFALFAGELPQAAPQLNNVPVNPALAGVVEVPAQLDAPPAPPVPTKSALDIVKSLVTDHMDKLLDLADCCTNLSRDELGYMQIDDAIIVCAEVIAINMDFFRKRLQGRLPDLLEKLLSGLVGSGSTAQQN